MTQSMFDPTSDDMNRGGSPYLPPEALQSSRMPADLSADHPADLIDAKPTDSDAPIVSKLAQIADDAEWDDKL